VDIAFMKFKVIKKLKDLLPYVLTILCCTCTM